MLKYQVRSPQCRPSSAFLSPSSSQDTTLTSRSSSLTSLNSIESSSSSGSEGEWGALRVFTHNIKSCTDYKTIRVSTQNTTGQIIDTVLNKFKLSCRDANLFELWMEVTTRADGQTVRTVLRLTKEARPLELQRCHPAGMSRFILHMNSNGSLVKVHDHNLCPQSNYKSLMLAPETLVSEAVQLVLAMNRKEADVSYGLFLTSPDAEAQIPDDISLVTVYKRCQPHHKIVIRQVDNF